VELINKLKEKIKNFEKTTGTMITMSDPVVTELLGQLDYDFFWVDTEHGPIDYYGLQLVLMAATASDTETLVRVPWNDTVMVKRVLDLGPAGIIFPSIRTVEEARHAMKACLYPPEGERGCGPSRAVRWGACPLPKYIERSKDVICRTIQIEHADTVTNLKEIVKIPEIDAYIFGPADLSGSIGELLKYREKSTHKLITEAVKILKDNGKYYGFYSPAYDVEGLKFWQEFEAPMVCAGGDTLSLARANREVFKAINDFQSLYEVKKA
jgi:2-dehydro-3-deoxyglucarate aldolase/4-hydroxy-2-oxoheptanedioate aldolase